MFRAFENLPSDAVYDVLDSPVGRLTLVASGEGLHALAWARDGDDVELVVRRSPRHRVLAAARAQLREYFAGKRRAFDLPLAPRGTPFQLRVWRELSKIPYGSTISYGEQARRIGDPRKARAVGTANGSNPLSIIVPCHRVIASTGALAGFGGGLANKRYLLDLEATAGGR